MLNFILSIGVIVLGGYLWWVGGHGIHKVRLLAFPVAIALVKFYLLHWNWVSLLYIPTMIALIASINYGNGSFLHKFWVWVFKEQGHDGTYLPVELCVRSSCGLLWSLASIWFVMAGGSWMYQVTYIVIMALLVPVFGVLVNSDFWSERGVGMTTSCAVLV